jgi:sigma-B regulation protein RsbU (phosphoserine phosphatase)
MRFHSTRLLLWLACVPACGAALMLPAQTPLKWAQGADALKSGWRTQAGDQTAWAAPDFDDSSWQLTALDESHPATNGANDERWYRLRIDLPAEHPPLALLVTGAAGSYEVYLNGRLVPGARLHSAWGITFVPKSSALPIDGSGPALIALRTRVPNSSVFFEDHNAFQMSIGTLAAIGDAARSEEGMRQNHSVVSFGIHMLLLFAAIPLILLSRFQRDHREYLWIGLNLLFLVFLFLGGLAAGGIVPTAFLILVAQPALYLATLAQIEFTFSFAGRPVTRPWRAYEVVILLSGLLLPPLEWNGYLGLFPYTPIEAACFLPASFLLPVLLLAWYRRGNREAGWLILPSLLPLLSSGFVDLGIIGAGVGSQRLSALLNQIQIGSLFVAYEDLSHLLYLMAIGIVIFLRFNRVTHQQARAATELEAAKRVQTLLLRSAHPEGGRFHIDAVYRPAAEVGGDFFHIAELHGVTRIVIGDVSGKGLGAAMLVSALIGALDTNRNIDPSAVLQQLNDLLLKRQQGGFATCQCVSINQDGFVAVANAGHLSPYRNGKEIDVRSGLPLGIAAQADYDKVSVELVAGDTLTFLSDGVIEARSATGELFGFDRTSAIATRTAEEVARAAQHFGQEDDITVLTLTFAPAEVLSS